MNELRELNKKGFVDGFSLVVFLVVVGSVIGGTYSLTQAHKSLPKLSEYYVGDIVTQKAYTCGCFSSVPESQRIYFSCLEIVKQFNYTTR